MKKLSNFINEANVTKETKIQETLSCLFFDAWFNLDNDFDNIEDLVEYYENHEDLVSQIASTCGLTLSDYNDFFLIGDKKGTQKTKTKEWQESFIYQCESFENWIKKHPSFNDNLVFIHHDSAAGVRNGKLERGWNITKRVDIGVKKYGYTDKDNYQKADIYAVVNKIDVTPEDDISKEITYWVQSIEGKESDKFVGISLKKIGRVLTNIHTYGLDQLTISVDQESVKFDMRMFENVKFDLSKGIIEPGIISSSIKFDINIDDEINPCSIDIRADGKGVKGHANKDPHVSFSSSIGTQIKIPGAGAQGGRAQSLISKWLKSDMKANRINGSKEYENKLQIIKNDLESNGIKFDAILDEQAKKLLDFLTVNDSVISNLYKSFEKDKSIESIQPFLNELKLNVEGKSLEDIMIMLYNATKWHNITWKSLCVYEAIAERIKENGLTETIKTIYQYGKGISSNDSDNHLPYVLIGEHKMKSLRDVL